MAELKQRIENEIKLISTTTLSDVFPNVIKRINFGISVEDDTYRQLIDMKYHFDEIFTQDIHIYISARLLGHPVERIQVFAKHKACTNILILF